MIRVCVCTCVCQKVYGQQKSDLMIYILSRSGDFVSMEGTPKDTVISRYKIMNGRKSKQKLLVQEAVLSINVIELVIHQIISFIRTKVWIETNIGRHIGINVCCVLYNLGSCFSRIYFKGKNTAILEKDDEIISAASIRIHGTGMAEMPFVATELKFGRKGLLQKSLKLIKWLYLEQLQTQMDIAKAKMGLHFSSNLEASKILKDFKLVMMHFTSNLTEMFESKMLQKSCIEVNEGGTEAAVVAATILTRSCLSRPHQIKIYWCSICLHADLLSVVFMAHENKAS
ncbi:unnamed protein product [Prunus brigantina]